MNEMNCLNCEEKLSDYLEQTLGADDRAALALHLESCESCGELLSGMLQVIETGRTFPQHAPPPWLAMRIVANTPRVQHESLRSLISAFWQSLGESRTALAIFTAAILVGWVGGGPVRESIVNRAESVMSCAYDRAIRSYYRSPMVIEIHSKLGQLMENS